MAQFAIPGTATVDQVLIDATFSSGPAGFDATGAIPNQGSPTFTPTGNVQTGPAGYYGGLTVDGVVVKVATGSATSAATTSTFYNTSGTAETAYPLSIPVPSGATEILAVFAGMGSVSGGDAAMASMSGYLNGGTGGPPPTAPQANCVCMGWSSASAWTFFESGGALSASTTGITLPVGSANWAVAYTVLYI